MKDTKHTPGPWTVIPSENYTYKILEWKGDLNQDEGNANLIAAAPELLEALEYAEYFFNGGATTPRHRQEIKEMIKKAIQKAKGL